MLTPENEIPKYRKKINKTIKKAKHKHIYEICLLYDIKSKYYYKGSYCIICGKIGNFGMETKRNDMGLIQMLSQDELKQKYKDCKVKEVTNISKVKYVSL